MKILLLTKSKIIFIIFCFVANTSNINAQEDYKQSSQDVIQLINESQQYYSTNDELINGCIYPLPSSRIQGNPYLNDKWSEATMYIGGKTYTNQLVKYDVVIGDVILQAEIEGGVPKLVNLNKFKVDSLLIGNTLFVNSRVLIHKKKSVNIKTQEISLDVGEATVTKSASTEKEETEKFAYLEQIHKGKNSLFKEYKKNFINEYNNITPHGKYPSTKTDLLLLKNNNLSSVNRKSSFLENFEKTQQNEIKTFLKKNNINYKKASTQELKQLMIFCTKTSTN